MSKLWIEQQIAHLELLKNLASRVPEGERLETDDLNKVLTLMDEYYQLFMTQAHLQGFKTEARPQ